jgi:hypothetical protein
LKLAPVCSGGKSDGSHRQVLDLILNEDKSPELAVPLVNGRDS